MTEELTANGRSDSQAAFPAHHPGGGKQGLILGVALGGAHPDRDTLCPHRDFVMQ